ncbi:TetR/AcrR family transcriptional regulator [Streptomyces bambusae]|uniref:TetR/AcrR family transcriptional regulator n=1 Tax=Streptomyces bambusae TaxID=1550616 RepID=UPI001CFEAB8C|nr:TetR/AcrR family transcriptional regulator [Streptomyces bambusae]MCB5165361.1 TetR/AcrR family transcriptional regulator [Streptomyces bambusae]
MGRPRGTTDEAILRAAVDVIGRLGPAGLTLAAVAREVGLVPGTLVQRFGSKKGLFLALADRAVQEAEAGAAAAAPAGEPGGSALDALTALVAESLADVDTPQRFAHHLAFLCLDLNDPELYARALAVHRARQRSLAALLTRAVADGELRPGTDAAALVRTVQAVTAGAGLTWALERDGSLAARVGHELEQALAPHRTVPRPGLTDLPEEA